MYDKISNRPRHHGEVRVAQIGGLDRLQAEGVFLISTAELLRTGILTRDDKYAAKHEWLVLDQIPAACIEADWSAQQFIWLCGNF